MWPLQTVYLLILNIFLIFQCSPCPPPIGQYIRVNSQPHNRSSEVFISSEKIKTILLCKIKVEENPFYKSPKCSGRNRFNVNQPFNVFR